jgi:glyoxylase-like metal-dependent hydrolase (beta-lactamase superfamily II)
MKRSFIPTAIVSIVGAFALAACSKTAEAPPAETSAPAPMAEAPPPAPKPENAHAFKIGDLSAIALRDGGFELPNDNKVFGVGKTPQDVAAVLSAAGQPTDKMSLSIQPLLVKTSDKVLLFDTGAGTNFGPGAGQLSTALAEAGVDPQTVTDIFISHLHGDHVGGLVSADGKLNFPNATIHISKPEWKFLQTVKADMAAKMGLSTRDALVAAMKPKVDAFAPGADLIPGVVKAVEIKGHTPGHSGYRITSGTDTLLYVGDSMHHYIISVAKADWPMAYDSDEKLGAKSRAALISELAASGQRIYAVHFPYPGIGKLEKQGDAIAWVAE